MSKIIYTDDQIEQLLKNKNIAMCSERSITYGNKFKIRAVKLYNQGLTSTEIFKQAGFDCNVIGKKKAVDCIRRWKRTIKKKGIKGLKETRGKSGRPKTKDL